MPATVIGNGNTLSVANGIHASLAGSNNTVTMGSNDTLTIDGGIANTINATGDAIGVLGNVSSLTVNGGGNTITTDHADTITIAGNGQYGWGNSIAMSNGNVKLTWTMRMLRSRGQTTS